MKFFGVGLGLVAGIAMVGLGIFFLALYEPWPISTRQGPDTYFAEDIFSRTFPAANRANVHEIYARDEWSTSGESIQSFRFDLSDDEDVQQATIDEIVAAYSLAPLTAGERAGTRVLDAPGWWPGADRLHAMPEAYGRGTIFLWVDRPQPAPAEVAEEAGNTIEGEGETAPPDRDPDQPARAYFQQANF